MQYFVGVVKPEGGKLGVSDLFQIPGGYAKAILSACNYMVRMVIFKLGVHGPMYQLKCEF